MRTSKLLNLGSMLLALGLAASAPADEVDAPVAEVMPGSEMAAPEPMPAAPDPAGLEAAPEAEAEPWAAEAPAPPALDAEPAAAEEGAVAVAPETPGEGEPVLETPEAASPEADPALAADPGMAAATDAMVLGAIGYDSQGRPGRIHLVRGGDTLWDISNAYLGTPWVWPSIWQDNQEIENPHLIYPGDRIWITPSEMRRITAEEAAALLAGSPAAPEPEAAPELEVVPPAPQVVAAEQLTYRISDREMVGLVSDDIVDASTSIVGVAGKVPKRILLAQGDRIWVGLGAGDVDAGDEFTAYRVQEKVYDPETGRMLGHHVNILGWVKVTEVGDEASLAVIHQSAFEMLKGDLLMPRKPPVTEIAIQPSPGDVDGQVSFFPHHREVMGTLEYVYLNRGTLDGIQVGSPLVVYRKGFEARDTARDEKVQVPDRVVADLLVVRVQPETAVALIRHTEDEIELGDRFRGLTN